MGSRELPCPNRIFDDIGGGFGMGLLGGCVFYFFKGISLKFLSKSRTYKLSEKRKILRRHITSKTKSSGLRRLIFLGNFGLWAGLFSTFDCALLYFRNVDDHYNPIISGFVTGGVLAIRAGPRVAFRNAIFGGVILGMIQLAEVVMIKMQKQKELEFQNQRMAEEVAREKQRRREEMSKYRQDVEGKKGPKMEQRVVQF